jgi:thymidylate synthase
MKQYLDLLQNILDNGIEKESGRANMPNTIGISNGIIKMDMKDGFPLLTTKKMYFKGIVHELLWMLRGDNMSLDERYDKMYKKYLKEYENAHNINPDGSPLSKEDFIEKIKKDNEFYDMFKIPFKSVNIKYLVDNNINIWNSDAYRWYLTYAEDNGGLEQNCILRDNIEDNTYSMYTYDQFIEAIKNTPSDKLPVYKFTEMYIKKHNGIKEYRLGDLGKVYGYQWRNQNGVDQVRDVIEGLKNNPYSRYHIIDAWNKADFKEMALPPCHLLYQFIVRPLSNKKRNEWYRNHGSIHTNRFDPDYNFENEFLDKENVPKFYLDLNMYQRSCDTLLGVPFNLASMSLLLMIISKVSNMIQGIATWIGGDVHIYKNHIPQVKEQLSREPYTLPELQINKDIKTLEDIENLTFDDFQLNFYTHHDVIKAELFTGVKK